MFRENKRKYGLKRAIQLGIQQKLGMATFQDQLDTLYFFLSQTCDIRNVKPAEGSIRELQLCDGELLHILDKVFRKLELIYWVDYGTLLGTVRHNGFIPWDDDVDICMLRHDYEKALSLLPSKLGKFGIKVEEYADEPNLRIGVSYDHIRTGIWIDIFPIDEINVPCDISEEAIKENIWRFKSFYRKKRKRMGREELSKARDKSFSKLPRGENSLIVHGPEFDYSKVLIHEKNKVFPLRRLKYEGFEVSVPNDSDYYLKKFYGNYMGIPKSGIEHHSSQDGKISEWASKSGVNMAEIKTVLEDIYNKL